MIEPKRFLDIKGAPDEVTYLLRAARRDVPPLGLRSNTWQALVAKSVVAGVVVGAAGAASTKGTAMAAGVASASGSSLAVSAHGILSKGMLMLALKSVSVCGGLGICAVATHHVLAERGQAEVSRPAKTSAAGRAIGVRRVAERRDLVHSETGTEQPAATQAPAAPERPDADDAVPVPSMARVGDAVPVPSTARVQLRAARAANPTSANADVRAYPSADDSGERARFEAQHVADIRRMLRSGEGVGALQALRELDQQASMHLLIQEREALKIDAHLLLGHDSEVRRLAQRFRRRYPNSPLATRWPGW